MSLFATMVTRNEAPRYLPDALANLSQVVDRIFVYDDRSTDATVEIAQSHGATVAIRPRAAQSFIENEGAFRQVAWTMFELAMEPQWGDWVLAIDADEVLAGTDDLASEIRTVIQQAELQGAVSVRLPIPEVFAYMDGAPFIRTDGFWGKIKGTRLFRYQLGGSFKDKTMGCGAEPTYAEQGPVSDWTRDLFLMHFGYAEEEDQVAKYQRYTSLEHGHSDQHIASILGPRTLVRWKMPCPEMRYARAEAA